jgi:hypothetical protein
MVMLEHFQLQINDFNCNYTNIRFFGVCAWGQDLESVEGFELLQYEIEPVTMRRINAAAAAAKKNLTVQLAATNADSPMSAVKNLVMFWTLYSYTHILLIVSLFCLSLPHTLSFLSCSCSRNFFAPSLSLSLFQCLPLSIA